MQHEDVIRFWGTVADAMRAIGCQHSSWYQFHRKPRVPDSYARRFEEASGGVLRANVDTPQVADWRTERVIVMRNGKRKRVRLEDVPPRNGAG